MTRFSWPAARLPALRTQPAPGAWLPLTAAFDVKQINITGNTRFDTTTLHALSTPVESLRLTLSQLTRSAVGFKN